MRRNSSGAIPWALLAAVVAPVDDCDDPREWIRRRDAARAALAERGAP